jgi:type II secretory pathway predicted ATPase ExeA
MSIILMGQPEIEKRLERKEYEAFRQRLALRYTLEPLSEKETIAYIEHRLRLVGGEPDIFTMEAKKLIYRLTSGIPRKINNLAGSCLLEGFGRGAKKIGVEIVEDAGKDLGMKEQQQAA